MALQQQQQQQQQPDFARVQTKFEELGIQFGLCANLPAVQDGRGMMGILEEIREQGRQTAVRLASLETRWGERWDEREVRDAARDANAFTRFFNTRVVDPDRELQPLRALATNEDIQEFPRTIAQMNTISSAPLNEILRLLEQPTHGDIAQRRRRLKLFSGVLYQEV
ncbi:hypothetical protein F4801DRAFT_530270 [Xylaria longipes]|nr:hypothetical protein F4801DRAFT_530270 [Xylaria longipes]